MLCDWPIRYLDCGDGELPEAVAELSDGDREVAESMARRLLWNWTGRRFGLCDGTIRPCKVIHPSATARFLDGLVDGSYRWGAVSLGGGTFYPCCGMCGLRACGCAPVSVRLPGIIQEVQEVRIDGTVLDPEAYRLDGLRTLVRVDGGTWPVTQDLDAPPGAEGTWEVDVTYGQPVPDGGQVAAGVLAVEFAKALCQDATCQLPQRVQTVTRQGVTIGTVLDEFEDLEKGRTGIWLVDSWVASEMLAPRGGMVFSVDVPRAR